MILEWSLIYFLLTGAGGTVVLDIWAWTMAKLFGVPATNWALVGRWLGHMRQLQFIQPELAKSEPVRHELAIGWLAHYLIGMAYGIPLLLFWGEEWLQSPTLWPPLLVSWFLLAAPFFIMMPGMGMGAGGSKTPSPVITRLKSVAGHTVFGLGMFLSAQMLTRFFKVFS